jgi:hypothetical protein
MRWYAQTLPLANGISTSIWPSLVQQARQAISPKDSADDLANASIEMTLYYLIEST